MNRELIMSTLFARLDAAPLVFDFTADIRLGDVVLTNISDRNGLFVGLPITGDGAAADTVLATIEPTVTLSQPATKTSNGVSLRQGFRTISRRLKGWEETTDQPALFLVDADETHPPRPSSGPADITLSAEIYLYVRSAEDPAPDIVPAAPLNTMIDAIEAVIDPPRHANPGLLQNLGLKGIRHCRIEGDVVKAGAVNGTQALALLPIKISVAQGVATAPL